MAAVGTAVVTGSKIACAGEVKKYSILWTSSAGGAVSANPFAVIKGRIVQARFTPSGGGTAPSDNYGVAVNDDSGADVLKGGGAARSATVTSIVTLNPPVLIDSVNLDVVVSAAGNAKQGTVDLYVQ